MNKCPRWPQIFLPDLNFHNSTYEEIGVKLFTLQINLSNTQRILKKVMLKLNNQIILI